MIEECQLIMALIHLLNCDIDDEIFTKTNAGIWKVFV